MKTIMFGDISQSEAVTVLVVNDQKARRVQELSEPRS